MFKIKPGSSPPHLNPPPKSVPLTISTIPINDNSIFPVTQAKITPFCFSDVIVDQSRNLPPSKYANFDFLNLLQCY